MMSLTKILIPDARINNSRTQKSPFITVAIITHNGLNVIENCLNSLLDQTYQPAQIIVIDNASSDYTPEWIEEHYSNVKVIRLSSNRGPSPARNQAILHTPDHHLTLLVDDDAQLKKNCLNELVKAYQHYPTAAILAPRLVYHDRRNTLQHEGVFIHYTGEAVLLNPDQPLHQGVQDITPVHAISGTCMLVSKLAAIKIGLFDEDYFFGRTDGEFTFRLTISGYELYTVPQALCYHRVKKRGLSKLFYQVRNRWYFMLTIYSFKTLVLIAPALLVYELCLISFLFLTGNLEEYLKAIFEVYKSLEKMRIKRKKIKSLKVRLDRDLLQSQALYMREYLLKNPILVWIKSGLDKFFWLYWQLIRPFL